MSERARGGAEADRTRPTVHSLHLWRERPAGAAPGGAGPARLPLKPDRLAVGLIAGLALLYLLGHALGLGRRRETHGAP